MPHARQALHRDRAGPARPRRLGQAAGRLLARRLRQRRARPADRPRPRARDVRRALARRRRRHAARLPVPRAMRAPGPDRQRRPRLARSTCCCARPRCPGSEFVLPLLAHPRLLERRPRRRPLLRRLGLNLHTDIAEMARGHASLADREARAAFVHTLRTIVDPGGQRVNANDRLYLAEQVPFLIIWGERDRDHPGRARPRGARARAGQPPRDLRGRGPLPAGRRAAALHRGADRVHRHHRAGRRRRLGVGRPAARRRARPSVGRRTSGNPVPSR